MTLKLVLLSAAIAVPAPLFAQATQNGSQPFDWCTRNKQRYGYEAPTGTTQPCFQVDRFRGNGDESRTVGVRRENRPDDSDEGTNWESEFEAFLGL